MFGIYCNKERVENQQNKLGSAPNSIQKEAHLPYLLNNLDLQKLQLVKLENSHFDHKYLNDQTHSQI